MPGNRDETTSSFSSWFHLLLVKYYIPRAENTECDIYSYTTIDESRIPKKPIKMFAQISKRFRTNTAASMIAVNLSKKEKVLQQ